MKFGMPSLIEFGTVEEHARFCAENGLDFYEINLAFPWFQSDKIDAYGLCEDEYLGYVQHFIALVESSMKGMDCIFCIENTSGYRFYHRHAIELMLKSPVFGLTFDIGHNYKASEDDESFILSHADKLRHFHIHDVTKTSNHVALGRGVLDVDRYLEMVRKYNCPAVIEVKEQNALIESLDYVKAHFTRF